MNHHAKETDEPLRPNPRRPNRLLLICSAFTLAAWIAFLVFIALQAA
jgi:hypothetical protein